MNVYEYTCDTDSFKTVGMKNRYFEVFDQFQVQSMKDVWEEVPVSLCGDDVRMPDLLQVDYRVPVLTGKALSILEGHFSEGIECLPLQSSECELWALNIWKPVDCLVVEESDVRKTRFGSIVEIKRGVFRNGGLRGEGLFTIPTNRFVFMTELFLQRIQTYNLSGLTVSKVGETA